MSRALIWIVVVTALAALSATLFRPAERLARHLAGQVTVAGMDLDRPVSQDRTQAETDVSNILAFAPFGDPAMPESEAPDTPTGRVLDLALRGVLAAQDQASSRALILVSGKGGFYRVGDNLARDAVLTAINPETVEVEVDGTAQTYGFDGILRDDEPVASASATGDADETASTTGSPLDRFNASVTAGRGSLDLREAPPPETTQEYIAMWRQRIIDSPNEVLETIGLVAGADGYTIREDPNTGVILAGLRPGDVVTRVNGQSVGDPEQDTAFYDEVAASGHARLEVVRGDEKILMSFPLR
ncbi:hypothetical protein ATO6_10170 [Oceanicola sp. 22II-s10i]|uniref:type II secretion system protein N n=1 Tax=Oceanicola sp. 22II-s10i TaxID=1317116 RepID=UPI000B523886|nr:type II secretion system protein N [Oceanicola sp. 22II-s10i]OWU84706.1 hypothetical protein ATO6_10170 [Oceanicola sp. 22II-s10i]